MLFKVNLPMDLQYLNGASRHNQISSHQNRKMYKLSVIYLIVSINIVLRPAEGVIFKKNPPIIIARQPEVIEKIVIIDDRSCSSDRCKSCRNLCNGNDRCQNDCFVVEKCRSDCNGIDRCQNDCFVVNKCRSNCNGNEKCQNSCAPDKVAKIDKIDKCRNSCNGNERCQNNCFVADKCRSSCNGNDRCQSDCVIVDKCRNNCNGNERCHNECVVADKCRNNCNGNDKCVNDCNGNRGYNNNEYERCRGCQGNNSPFLNYCEPGRWLYYVQIPKNILLSDIVSNAELIRLYYDSNLELEPNGISGRACLNDKTRLDLTRLNAAILPVQYK